MPESLGFLAISTFSPFVFEGLLWYFLWYKVVIFIIPTNTQRNIENFGFFKLFQILAFSDQILALKSKLAKIWTFSPNPSKILAPRENSEFHGFIDVYNLPKYLRHH